MIVVAQGSLPTHQDCFFSAVCDLVKTGKEFVRNPSHMFFGGVRDLLGGMFPEPQFCTPIKC